MDAYLVKVRLPAGDGNLAPIAILVAVCATDSDAINAVKDAVPGTWAVEGVLGIAEKSLVLRRGLKPGDVQQLA